MCTRACVCMVSIAWVCVTHQTLEISLPLSQQGWTVSPYHDAQTFVSMWVWGMEPVSSFFQDDTSLRHPSNSFLLCFDVAPEGSDDTCILLHAEQYSCWTGCCVPTSVEPLSTLCLSGSTPLPNLSPRFPFRSSPHLKFYPNQNTREEQSNRLFPPK